MRVRGRVVSNDTRERLQAARTYYVRTDGNDSNTGLANTSGGAFLTVQAAINAVFALDISTYAVTIQIADGTYSGAANFNGFPVTETGAVTIQGNAGNNTSVKLTNTIAFACRYLVGSLTLKDLQLGGATIGLYATNGSLVSINNVDFAGAGPQLYSANGSKIIAPANYTVSASATYHAYALYGGGIVIGGRTIVFSNNPAYTTNWFATMAGWIYGASMTFTNGNTVTGKRYDATMGGVIDAGGGGANYVPGNSAGTTATGGQYL